jgi:hypothetical protein
MDRRVGRRDAAKLRLTHYPTPAALARGIARSRPDSVMARPFGPIQPELRAPVDDAWRQRRDRLPTAPLTDGRATRNVLFSSIIRCLRLFVPRRP